MKHWENSLGLKITDTKDSKWVGQTQKLTDEKRSISRQQFSTHNNFAQLMCHNIPQPFQLYYIFACICAYDAAGLYFSRISEKIVLMQISNSTTVSFNNSYSRFGTNGELKITVSILHN